MRKGRRPKPTALKIIAGNPGKRPLNKNEPVYASLEIGNPPEDSSEEVKSEWFSIGSQLAEFGILQTVDRHIFHRYCDALVRWKRIVRFLDTHAEACNPSGIRYPILEQKFKRTEKGNWIPEFDESGNPIMQTNKFRVLPEVAEYRRLNDTLLKLENELGLSPAARTRVSTASSIKRFDNNFDIFDINN
jgi:P27 family predicted phage terminase small subunit